MTHILRDTADGWVATKDPTKFDDLARRIKHADLIVSDLDDTDAPSPAKAEAYRCLLQPRRALNPRFWAWCAATAWKLLREGDAANLPQWLAFKEQFLDEPALRDIAQRHTPKSAITSMFPGAQHFYIPFLRRARRYYVTGNIPQITDAYLRANAFDGMLCDQYDKARSIERLLSDNISRDRILIKGNAAEDQEMLDVLRAYRQRGLIQDYMSIHVAKSKNAMNPAFDINIGQDYRALNSLLRKR